ncbi:MAG: DUF5017 domain-containing protein [Bacteroidales bacterium]|nr:DUF5017 domain-containing protein [Bacteroidales bacterium]
MKKIIYSIFTVLILGLAGCADSMLDVVVPSLDVTVDTATYDVKIGEEIDTIICKVGEEVKFNFSGDANYVYFYPGIGLFSNDLVSNTTDGSRYEFRNRTQVDNGNVVLTFANSKANAATKAGSLQLMYSTDFGGNLDKDTNLDSIGSATWTDISNLVTWSTSTSNVTSTLDMNPFKELPIYLAFKFTGDSLLSQYGWNVSSLVMNHIVPTDQLPYVIWKNASIPKFGRASTMPNYVWQFGTTLKINANAAAHSPYMESWLIVRVDLKAVTPDVALKVKSFSEVTPEFTSYQYWQPGTYTATFVSSNASIYGKQEKIKQFVITVEP